MATTKNLTVTLSQEEHSDLDFLVEYFQKHSISTVTKSDVIKFMIRNMKRTVEQDLLNELTTMIVESENNNNNTNNINTTNNNLNTNTEG